jgi:hypothetical protein
MRLDLPELLDGNIYLMTICAIVMETFSIGINSQSFQVNFYFLFDVSTLFSKQYD